MILLTHTVTILIQPDPDMDIKAQCRELETNCEAIADYAFGEGKYTQDTECAIENFIECTKAITIATTNT